MSIGVTRGGGNRNGREILPTNSAEVRGQNQDGSWCSVCCCCWVRGILKPAATHLMTPLFILQNLLAHLLAIFRQCCAAREHVEGVYVIDQSACDSALYKDSLKQDDYKLGRGLLPLHDLHYGVCLSFSRRTLQGHSAC